MKRILKMILYKSVCSFLILLLIIGISPKNTAATEYKDESVEMMYEWLLNTQLSNGALPVYGEENGDASIVPYFSSIALLAILEYGDDQQSSETAIEYFNWYFERINTEDGEDFSTIYDYTAVIEDRQIVSETSKQMYDSADSYAALFLAALWKYVEKTGDKEYILENFEKINNIINLQFELIDEDGLSFVSRTNKTKYLMDNCEVSLGLFAANKLLGEVSLTRHKFFSKEYWTILRKMIEIKKARVKLNKSINELLWNEVDQLYEIGISSNGEIIAFKDYDDFYPDAIAQIFPIVFGIVKPESSKAKIIYRKFSDAHKWEDLSHYKDKKTNFYWGVGAYCGAVMGDIERVNKYIASFEELAMPDFSYPAYNADVAWIILAAQYDTNSR